MTIGDLQNTNCHNVTDNDFFQNYAKECPAAKEMPLGDHKFRMRKRLVTDETVQKQNMILFGQPFSQSGTDESGTTCNKDTFVCDLTPLF